MDAPAERRSCAHANRANPSNYLFHGAFYIPPAALGPSIGGLLGLCFARGFPAAQAGRAVLLNSLATAGDGQGVGRHIVGNHRPGRHVGPRPDAHGRHQGRIRADEGTLAYVSMVLGDAVVIAHNRSGPDITAVADPRVADT